MITDNVKKCDYWYKVEVAKKGVNLMGKTLKDMAKYLQNVINPEIPEV